ncbi:hypothetical protein D0A29_13305 [Salmonella enterica]|nr:hypothetical protein [Salmonella enterica]
MLRKSAFWCSFTATRQQSRTSLQAAARNVKSAGVAAGAGFTGKFPAQSSIDQISGADKKR